MTLPSEARHPMCGSTMTHPPKPDIQCLELKRCGSPEQAGKDSNTQNMTEDPWDPNLGPGEIYLHLEILASLLI